MSFDFDFTQQKLEDCIDNSDIDDWFQPICDILPSYQITSMLRVAAWLAQMGHESEDFCVLEENLNYSAKGLRTVFPRYFPTDALALQYQRNPEKIANRVYDNRMGNGPEESGDGWKFHGRGLIQITGKDNYTHCSNALYGDLRLLDNPELICDMDGAIRSACWFWNSRELNDFADNKDMITITRRINGGTNGLTERVERYQRILNILNS
jgi:putative chitinase